MSLLSGSWPFFVVEAGSKDSSQRFRQLHGAGFKYSGKDISRACCERALVV